MSMTFCLPSSLILAPDAFMVYACERVSRTVASAAKATTVSTAIDGRSPQSAGGIAADAGNAACQRAVRPSATVSRGTPDLPVTQVKLLEKAKGESRELFVKI